MVANDGHLVSSSDLGGEEEPFLADGIKCKELNFLNIPFYFHLKKYYYLIKRPRQGRDTEQKLSC